MNEIKRQLQMKIGDTAQQQQNVIRKINERYPMREKKKKPLFPAVASLALLVATCLFVFSFIGEEELRTPAMNDVSIPIAEEKESTFDTNEVLTPITEEQKQQYYQQYVEIVEKAMEKKTGLSIGVAPIEEFKESDWVEPAEFEKRIQYGEEVFLATEREKLAAVSNDLKPAVTHPNGETTKAKYLYFPDILEEIEVTAIFDTQLDEDKSRQLFSNVSAISTKIVSSSGKWEQTFQKATLLDGGRTYRIYIEGIFDLNNLTFEKAFTIEFQCDEFGNIY
ncbi:hypothetical protein [Sporosarcina psychrophila]|uniref:hypothetical protein n=1 Tax=Sporosarcina psychrophila TaxID=1476 RepID=UPI00078D0E59|nr:hypothetical protein [Sporosarcina psychrophila]AMQ06716.1 hypothetical protein AZE41_12670 [Sporosarcina psychrophila]